MWRMQKQKRLTVGLLAAYLIVLTWIIVFKMQLDFSEFAHYRHVNLIPFGGALVVNGRINISEMLLNVVVFIQFGVYLCMLGGQGDWLKKAVPVLGVSLAYEAAQYILAVGGSDVTDLLLNTAGGILGFALFGVLQKLLKGRTVPVLNLLALAGRFSCLRFWGCSLARIWHKKRKVFACRLDKFRS